MFNDALEKKEASISILSPLLSYASFAVRKHSNIEKKRGKSKAECLQVRGNPKASPLRSSPEVFPKLPPAVILLAECDILRCEGEEFGRELNEAGIRAEVIIMQGLPHGRSHALLLE